MSEWRLSEGATPAEVQAFASLEAVFATQGREITRDPLSEVILCDLDGQRYYIKRYLGAGKGLRRFIGRPRVKAEWQNLKHFIKWGVPTAPVVGFGLERKGWAFSRGALITRELPATEDMAQLAQRNAPCLRDGAWVATVSAQLADATRTLHEHNFAHNDLKWRNLLVNDAKELFLIDCPAGSFWWGPFLRYRIIKDLACLDKVAKYHLTRTQRLRFYLQYCGHDKLDARDKKYLWRIINFFEGRE
ncbi:lipopolysaccharide kinase InaA family protein [Pseudomonas marincola]|uniref:lipopolysaccharide kinase InaA family protein n=1 Tax=Pseudomonas marincola TaxID=437900 RepID=UPI0008F07C76|nr:lipopolysaccharide kinase InaA family protein [Pseudomonas marincola]SFT73210.1 Lipopolysaccharide kinase (Kdo/WaaP) family protein [Pseudomonas marincola]